MHRLAPRVPIHLLSCQRRSSVTRFSDLGMTWTALEGLHHKPRAGRRAAQWDGIRYLQGASREKVGDNHGKQIIIFYFFILI